jgi:4-hydroxybenzoate polyprenyltransferase
MKARKDSGFWSDLVSRENALLALLLLFPWIVAFALSGGPFVIMLVVASLLIGYAFRMRRILGIWAIAIAIGLLLNLPWMISGESAGSSGYEETAWSFLIEWPVFSLMLVLLPLAIGRAMARTAFGRRHAVLG